ncbi:MAG: phosphomannomutase/phosphoglucomutase [Francisellaceae bacterium]|jgi:phosphomannomutase / phosphoglucomutase|nr:phosphomannomutase/phosphoglucomutase [Francisellaceae bacterium]MBT6207330.1 phosphomannomutase/phosphoglucomutase [Francisellaceae bacterium]MBT6538677.1 phosphomannomutase/phosphoglucomutase [Francisellaceae bacterium]
MGVSNEIFRAYDIRGIVDESLSCEIVYKIGQAFGTKVRQASHNITKVIIGRDGRLSGPKLANSLAKGIQATGCDVISVGAVATPLLYYASKKLNIPSAVMLTGSHNPSNYNGLKMILEDKAIYGEQIQEIKNIINSQEFLNGDASYSEYNIEPEYMQEITHKINTPKPLKIVIDAGNGIPGAIAPQLFKNLGHEVIALFCEVDGNFPNHHPDPGDPNNLKDLIQSVIKNNADIGLAFDGDGDRLGIIDSNGKIIWPDRSLMAFAQDVLKEKNNSTIIYDIKSTNNLDSIIKAAGGKPLMYKTGHSLIKAKMRETGAALAGEMSGHVFFAHNWYGFDDALYAGAKILEIIAKTNESSATFFAKFPENVSTPELPIDVTEDEKFGIIKKLQEIAHFPGAKNISTIDGLRVDFDDRWGLIRCSNTSPKLISRFEGLSNESLKSIQDSFKQLLLQVAPHLKTPF